MKFGRRKENPLEARWSEVTAEAEAVGWRVVVTLAAPDTEMTALTRETNLAAQIEVIAATLTDPLFVALRQSRARADQTIKAHVLWKNLAAGSLERVRTAVDEEDAARQLFRSVVAARVGDRA